MANRTESTGALVKEDEKDADAAAKRNQDDSACDELPRVPQLLAERTLRRVLTVRKFVMLRARGMVGAGVRQARIQAIALNIIGRWRAMNVALDSQHLNS